MTDPDDACPTCSGTGGRVVRCLLCDGTGRDPDHTPLASDCDRAAAELYRDQGEPVG